MSADNGVYILETKDQYRVAHLKGIENVYWSAVDGCHDECVSTRVVEMWGKCKFTRDKKKALNIAYDIVSQLYICEYGVGIITCNKTWAQILKDAQAYAKKEIKTIKSRNEELLWDMKMLQDIADGKFGGE